MLKSFLKLTLVCVSGVAMAQTPVVSERGAARANADSPRAGTLLAGNEATRKDLKSNKTGKEAALKSSDLKVKPNDKLGSKEPAGASMNENDPTAKPGLNSNKLKAKPADKLGSKEPAK